MFQNFFFFLSASDFLAMLHLIYWVLFHLSFFFFFFLFYATEMNKFPKVVDAGVCSWGTSCQKFQWKDCQPSQVCSKLTCDAFTANQTSPCTSFPSVADLPSFTLSIDIQNWSVCVCLSVLCLGLHVYVYLCVSLSVSVHAWTSCCKPQKLPLFFFRGPLTVMSLDLWTTANKPQKASGTRTSLILWTLWYKAGGESFSVMLMLKQFPL